MPLTLTIENETRLPDGGPLSVSISGKRGIDIGRDQHLDWTLPDPTRYISGKHCEIRYQDGGYWLHDVSTNGTYLYGSDVRLREPHRLRNGDRLVIGQYIIAVSVVGEEQPAAGRTPGPAPAAASHDDLWLPAGEVPPPIDPRQLRPPRDSSPVKPDFLDWAVDVPNASTPSARDTADLPAARRAPAAEPDDLGWAYSPPKPPPPQPELVPIPTPRRPQADGEQGASWETPAPSPPPAPPQVAPPRRAPAAAAVEPPAPVSREASAASLDRQTFDDFIQHLARGAGVAPEVFAAKSPEELAEYLGGLIRLVAESVRQLLDARLQAKQVARSANQTMIQALNNNPLKFSPTPEEALRIMFGPRTKSYLDARQSFEQSFNDLKSHQIKTFSAMQHAVRLLVADLDPKTIEAEDKGGGLAAMVGSRKARLWDSYVARWQERTRRHEDGLVDAFMTYFAECYDREGNQLK